MTAVEARYLEAEARARRNIPRMVRGLLAFRGLDQGDLARALDISASSLSERLSGKTRISAGEVARMASFLGVEPGHLYADPDASLRPTTLGDRAVPGSRIF